MYICIHVHIHVRKMYTCAYTCEKKETYVRMLKVCACIHHMCMYMWMLSTKLVRNGGNRFVDLSETGSCPAPKGSVSFSEVGLRPTSLNLTKPLMAPAYRNWFVDLCVNRFVGA